MKARFGGYPEIAKAIFRDINNAATAQVASQAVGNRKAPEGGPIKFYKVISIVSEPGIPFFILINKPE